MFESKSDLKHESKVYDHEQQHKLQWDIPVCKYYIHPLLVLGSILKVLCWKLYTDKNTWKYVNMLSEV